MVADANISTVVSKKVTVQVIATLNDNLVLTANDKYSFLATVKRADCASVTITSPALASPFITVKHYELQTATFTDPVWSTGNDLCGSRVVEIMESGVASLWTTRVKTDSTTYTVTSSPRDN